MKNLQRLVFVTNCLIAIFGCEIGIAEDKVISLSDAMKKAKKIPVEYLVAPIKTVRVGNTLMVPNADKKTWDILQVYFTNYGGPNEIIIIDGESGEIQHVKIPRKPYIMQWHMCQSLVAPNGKLFIYTGGQTPLLHIYDPADNSLKVSAVKLPAEFHSPAHGHPMILGPDGKIYCAAGYGKKRFGVCRIDPDTLKVVDYGPIGKAEYGRNLPWSIAVDKTHVYVVGAKLPWSLATYDLKTGKTDTLFASPHEMSVKQTPFGCTFVMHGKGGGFFWLDNGKAVSSKDTPPAWVAAWKAKGINIEVTHPNKPEVVTGQAQPGADGKCNLWIRRPVNGTKTWDSPEKSYKTPEEAGWKRYSYTVDTTLCNIQRIIALPDGRIFGTGTAYGGEFIYNPATGKSKFLGKSNTNTYTMSILGDNVYFSGYPSSGTWSYNFKKPWNKILGGTPPGVKMLADTDPKQNPRFIGYLAKEAGTHKVYASAVGSDGCIYFGGRMMRDGSGGGLAWYDTKTGEKGGIGPKDGIADIFSNYQIRHMTSVDNGRYIVISAHATDDQTLKKKRPACGRLFIFDTAAKKIVKTIDPLPDCNDVGVIVGVGKDSVLGLTYPDTDRKKTKLYRVNIKTGKMAFIKELNVPIVLNHYGNQTEAFDFHLGPDKKVWTILGHYHLVKITPESGDIEVVGKLPTIAGRMAFSGNDLYFSGNVRLRKIPNVIGSAKK